MKRFYSMVNKVIDRCDIIILVIDARFPELTRNKNVEQKILKADKKILYVVNKIDLVKSFDIIAKIRKIRPRIEISIKKKIGIKTLRDTVKRHAADFDHNVYVGVVGYPNTGKSSIINALAQKKTAITSSESGMTKGMQFVRLSTTLMLVDSPGVFPQDNDDEHVLVSAVDFTKLKEPDYFADLLFERFPKQMKKHYGVTCVEDYAENCGYLKKGGVPDINRAAKEVLKEWQQGKIIV